MDNCKACGSSLWAYIEYEKESGYCLDCLSSGQAEYDKADRLGK